MNIDSLIDDIFRRRKEKEAISAYKADSTSLLNAYFRNVFPNFKKFYIKNNRLIIRYEYFYRRFEEFIEAEDALRFSDNYNKMHFSKVHFDNKRSKILESIAHACTHNDLVIAIPSVILDDLCSTENIRPSGSDYECVLFKKGTSIDDICKMSMDNNNLSDETILDFRRHEKNNQALRHSRINSAFSFPDERPFSVFG